MYICMYVCMYVCVRMCLFVSVFRRCVVYSVSKTCLFAILYNRDCLSSPSGPG